MEGASEMSPVLCLWLPQQQGFLFKYRLKQAQLQKRKCSGAQCKSKQEFASFKMSEIAKDLAGNKCQKPTVAIHQECVD